MANFDNRILNLKQILEEKYCREITLDQAKEAYRTLDSLANISLTVAEEEIRRRNMLSENPRGFHYDRDGCSCRICQRITYGLESWYDRYGLKCLICQHALNQKIIPASVAKDKSSWYSNSDLERYFNIGKKELTKYIKSGFLKNRVILTDAKKLHLQLFLLTDNKGVLPPKSLVKPRIVLTERNGEDYFTDASWYEVVDAKGFEKLKKYRIVECFQETFSKPLVQSGHFYWKFISPFLIPEQG